MAMDTVPPTDNNASLMTTTGNERDWRMRWKLMTVELDLFCWKLFKKVKMTKLARSEKYIRQARRCVKVHSKCAKD